MADEDGFLYGDDGPGAAVVGAPVRVGGQRSRVYGDHEGAITMKTMMKMSRWETTGDEDEMVWNDW
jgi:hypothetical protein